MSACVEFELTARVESHPSVTVWRSAVVDWCDIVSSVTRYQTASPCWCGWYFIWFVLVLESGQVESSKRWFFHRHCFVWSSILVQFIQWREVTAQ